MCRSQTRGDNTNADGKRRETRYYSLWTSLQMGKIWSQVHDACKNVVKLAATSVGRIVKDAPKSERSPRNPVEVADVKALVESSSSCADKICEETCRKNLICLKSGTKSESHHERVIEDTGERRKDTEISIRENPRAITLPRRDMRKHAWQNTEKGEDEKSCVFYSGTINSNQSSTRLPVALIEPSKFIAYI
ncbi:uncharacterized protein [Linepithema humile]|uniref:uncharacterized protein isoform X4 n=1 Tax=Linepithema humile TaxID=83485 RepID=UPI00351F1646